MKLANKHSRLIVCANTRRPQKCLITLMLQTTD